MRQVEDHTSREAHSDGTVTTRPLMKSPPIQRRARDSEDYSYIIRTTIPRPNETLQRLTQCTNT